MIDFLFRRCTLTWSTGQGLLARWSRASSPRAAARRLASSSAAFARSASCLARIWALESPEVLGASLLTSDIWLERGTVKHGHYILNGLIIQQNIFFHLNVHREKYKFKKRLAMTGNGFQKLRTSKKIKVIKQGLNALMTQYKAQ